ncbi:nitroreductase family protein [Anaerovorax sp. IOR16]|uniref:nitroreductase family protein n=1 Tax=Anaerovorax sp. IOR16 TaxID=2773458 RepID=UPI0019CFF9B6|nr:nitroreductase family protein [Anaerovorax sp. IOR16]
MNPTKTMKIRKSMRTYKEIPIAEETKEKLRSYIKEVSGPFGKKMRFELVDKCDIDSNVKLGTYGVIKGAQTYICAIVERENRYEENLGYAFEKIILYATSLGLGTCWLGGTFKRSDFDTALSLAENEFIPVVTTVGYAKDNRSLIDRLLVISAGSKNRKDFRELFLNSDLEHPLNPEDAGRYKEAFEMVRIAPSGSNKQPWRVAKDENAFHFFLCRNKGYASFLDYDIQRLDMGIAMCHFDLTIKELGYHGEWEKKNLNFTGNDNLEYIISYIINEDK